MSFPWHNEVLPEEQEKFIEYATSLVANHEFFKNNPKFPHENIRTIAHYFVSQAWKSSSTKQIFLHELTNIPSHAEKHYRPQQLSQTHTQQSTPNYQNQQPVQQSHQIQHPQNQSSQQTQQTQQAQQAPTIDTQSFWEAFIGITKNKQECDTLRNDYAKAKLILERFREKKSKFVTICKPQDVEKKVQQLEVITKNLRVYFSDLHKHYQIHIEKNKDENAALANLINNSPIKKADQEILMLKKLSTIVQSFDMVYENWSRDLINKQTEHVTILKDLFASDATSQHIQQREEVLKFLCKTVHKLVEFPSVDDFTTSSQSNKRRIVDIYQSLPHKSRKYEEELFPMKDFMKQLLSETIQPSKTFYNCLKEKLTTGLESKFSVAFNNVKTKFEIDVRHFPRGADNTRQDIVPDEEQETFTALLSPVSVSSASELSCTTNLTDLQNVYTFQENENFKQFVIEIAIYAKLEDETRTGFLQLYLCPPMRIYVNYSQDFTDLVDPIIDFTTEGIETPKSRQYSIINTSINSESGRFLLSGPSQLSYIRENVLQHINHSDPINVKVQYLISSFLESALVCIDSVSIGE